MGTKQLSKSRFPTASRHEAETMQTERGLQAAETCVQKKANEFPDDLFPLTKGQVVGGVRVVWDGRCGRAFLRPEGRAPVGLPAQLRLRACLKTRPVRAPGLQATGLAAKTCWPRALTRRGSGVLKHALRILGCSDARRAKPQSENFAARSNPNGIVSSSPGLRGTSYPGSLPESFSNPNGVASLSAPQPRWGCWFLNCFLSQGSSFLAPLGWRPESRWDSALGFPRVLGVTPHFENE